MSDIRADLAALIEDSSGVSPVMADLIAGEIVGKFDVTERSDSAS